MTSKATKDALLHKMFGIITKALEIGFGTGFKVCEIKSQAITVKVGDQLIEIKFTFKKDENFNGDYVKNFNQVVSGKYE